MKETEEEILNLNNRCTCAACKATRRAWYDARKAEAKEPASADGDRGRA